MSKNSPRPSTIDGIKRLAKQIKAAQGLKHADALDAAARLGQFQNYAHARRQLGSGTAPVSGVTHGKDAGPSDQSVGWGRQWGKGWGGRRLEQVPSPPHSGSSDGGTPHSDGSRFSDGAGYKRPIDDGLTPRQRVERRLSELEEAFSKLNEYHSMSGQLRPSERPEISPLTDADIDNARKAIADVGSEIASELPDWERFEALGRWATGLSLKFEIALHRAVQTTEDNTKVEDAGGSQDGDKEKVTGPVYFAVLSLFADRLYALGDAMLQIPPQRQSQ